MPAYYLEEADYADPYWTDEEYWEQLDEDIDIDEDYAIDEGNIPGPEGCWPPPPECWDGDGDGVCASEDICPIGDDSIDGNGDGIPDACERNQPLFLDFEEGMYPGFDPNIEDQWASLGVTFQVGWARVQRSVSEGGSTYWGLEGSNGGSYVGLLGSESGFSATFDGSVTGVSMDISEAVANPHSNYSVITLTGSLGGVEVDSAQLQMGGQGVQWFTMELEGTMDSITLSAEAGTAPNYGIDNLRFTYAPSCDDDDGDGVCNSEDACPGFDDGIDENGDGVPDGCGCKPVNVTLDFEGSAEGTFPALGDQWEDLGVVFEEGDAHVTRDIDLGDGVYLQGTNGPDFAYLSGAGTRGVAHLTDPASQFSLYLAATSSPNYSEVSFSFFYKGEAVGEMGGYVVTRESWSNLGYTATGGEGLVDEVRWEITSEDSYADLAVDNVHLYRGCED